MYILWFFFPYYSYVAYKHQRLIFYQPFFLDLIVTLNPPRYTTQKACEAACTVQHAMVLQSGETFRFSLLCYLYT
jgi:hypothetical protein